MWIETGYVLIKWIWYLADTTERVSSGLSSHYWPLPTTLLYALYYYYYLIRCLLAITPSIWVSNWPTVILQGIWVCLCVYFLRYHCHFRLPPSRGRRNKMTGKIPNSHTAFSSHSFNCCGLNCSSVPQPQLRSTSSTSSHHPDPFHGRSSYTSLYTLGHLLIIVPTNT